MQFPPSSSAAARIAAIEALLPGGSPQVPTTIDSQGVGSGGAAGKLALSDHKHPSRVQRVSAVTDATGKATYALTCTDVSGLFPHGEPVVQDATGVPYTVTLVSWGVAQAAGVWTCTLVFQVSKRKLLPSVLTLLTALLNYDVFQAAGSGLPVYASFGPPTS